MRKATVLMAAVLVVITVLAAGLTVLSSTVQEAQANPCSVQTEQTLTSSDNSGAGAGSNNFAPSESPLEVGDQNCKFIGNIDIDEEEDTNIDLD